MGATILIVEDDSAARALLHRALTAAGYDCMHAATGLDAVASALEVAPHLVLLDLGLPDLDGLDVTTRIREQSNVPIIVVSGRAQEDEKIAALDGGANDYVTKPIAERELLARIRVALRAPPAPSHEDAERGSFAAGDLRVDFDNHRVTVAGAEVRLTPTEFRMIVLFMRAGGRVLTHRTILREIWGPRFISNMNYLRVFMKKLRHKIEKEPARPRYLLNEPGIGYRLRVGD